MAALSLELQALGWAALLAAVQLVLLAVAANLQLPTGYLVGARDQRRELTGAAGRLERALRNHLEGLLLFAVAALLVAFGGTSTPFTEGCALAYLAARVVYVPFYAFGIPWWRSAVWGVGFAATVLMLLAALL